MSIASDLTFFSKDTRHPALFTANHPMSLRIQFRRVALTHALSSVSSSLAYCRPLLEIIASYVPADLPYIRGISDICPYKYDYDADPATTDLSWAFEEPLEPTYDTIYAEDEDQDQK